jgi:LysM repeat protein
MPSGVPVAGPSTVRQSYTVQPGDTLTKVALLHDVSVVDLALSNGLKDTNAIRTGHSLVIPNRSLKVFYDSHPITVDVAAFAQAGIALAPFRPVFEHAGGTVKWSHKDKRLEAKNDDHTVEIRIGSETAKVDGEAVMLELAALIKKSRTMVPTSLFSKVMNVEVSFDPETGHIMVASR